MIIQDYLKKSAASIAKSSETPRLDSEVLLCHVLQKDRAWLFAHPDFVLQGASLRKVNLLLKRRINAEPIAYILGKCEFYGREFLVNKNVLVPRPESETLIDFLKKFANGKSKIIDVGTGSGALAITAKLELLDCEVIAVDIDSKCLSVAKSNANKHKAKIEFLQSDLLSKLPTTNYKLTTVLANLPYVPNEYKINEAAKHEPKLALYGGDDGLALYRRLFDQLQKFLVDSLRFTVLTESLAFQHHELAKIAEKAGFKQTHKQDLIQVFESR